MLILKCTTPAEEGGKYLCCTRAEGAYPIMIISVLAVAKRSTLKLIAIEPEKFKQKCQTWKRHRWFT